MLVVNEVGDEDFCDDVESYRLPVLQDTTVADVFGLWEASGYDCFIISREGQVAFAQSRLYPKDDYDHLVEVLGGFFP